MEGSTSVIYIESNRMSQRKQTVIDLLRGSQDFVSGEAMSAQLGISRNAVHKHVKSLRRRGYRILGVSRRGYRLDEEPGRLSMALVTDRTAGSVFGRSYRYYDEIESTNVEAKALANSGAPEGTVVIAEAQTAGRGRLGRRWTSPAGKGLLFSALLRPALPMSEAHLLTLVAACAAAEAVQSIADVAVSIKWPNDLFVGERKVGGILLEVAGEQDEVDWVVVGIGVNVNTEYCRTAGGPATHRHVAEDGRRRAGRQERAPRTASALAGRPLRPRPRERLRARPQRLPQPRLPAPSPGERAVARRRRGRSGERHRRARGASRRAPPQEDQELPLR